MKLKLPKLPKFPNFPHFPKPDIEPLKKVAAFLVKHKISITISIFSIVFMVFFVATMWYRGYYLVSKINQTSNSNNNEIFNSTSSNNPTPTIATPTPFPTVSSNNYSGSYNTYNNILPTPFPTFAPMPTFAPLPVLSTTTTNTSSSGNPHCTTGSGVPNSWYSDVYPNPSAASTNTGSITLYVYIRDCNQKTAPVSDNLTITLVSNDSTAKINGSTSPVTIQTQNGYASFTVSSENSTTDTFTIQDTTSNFTVTNINNQNPSITFTNTGSSSGNSNCTTAAGVPNFWYSEVSPASPVAANTGSTVTFTVHIRDCNQSDVSSDNLTFSQNSSDSSLTVNGSAPPVSVQVQNGVATFNVTSQNAGTDTFTIQDTTSSFTVTDANNHNPSVVFSGSSTVTPTPTPSLTDTPTPIATISGQ